MDKQNATLFILLDLSTAFDMVDHQILLNRLRTEFGVSGKVLDWFASYLSNRSQKVTVNGVLSDRVGIDFGVPQGSCLGPLLSVIYSSKLFNIVNKQLPNVHAYADDTQLYLAFKPGNHANETAAVSSIQSCIRDRQNGMLIDKLKLNPDKTEFLILETRQQVENVITSHLVVGESRICPSTKVKNLGSWFDPNLDMISHINNICSSSFYYLYNICRIRKYLSPQSAISLIHVFITTKLDYCNSLLYGLPTIHIDNLQRVQNATTRLVTKTPCICHITPILEDLYWLPIKYRIQCKIVLLTFKCLYGLAPQYLVDLIAVAPQSRYNLRSRNATLLVSANARCLPTLGDGAFQSAAPKLWNSLPVEIRNIQTLTSFKQALKTYLFKTAFNRFIYTLFIDITYSNIYYYFNTYYLYILFL